MILADPGQTSFDLRFRLFRTFVRVHPLFWLLSAVLGWNLTAHPELPGNGLSELALWIACCFFSILLHEFGHVLAFRAFGNDAHIVLHSFGGLAIPDGVSPWRWQRIVVSAAGPAIQLALYGALVGMLKVGWLQPPLDAFEASLGREWAPAPAVFLDLLLQINLAWPLLNLFPIWPLDGGQISREVCEAVWRWRGAVISLWASLIVSAALAVNALLAKQGQGLPYLPGGLYVAILFGMLAVGSYQALQVERSRGRGWDEDGPWGR